MDTTRTITTADELLDAGDIGRCELNHGELSMMTPAGGEHGFIPLRLGRFLGAYVDEHRLGAAFGGEAGYLIERDPDTVRVPDLSFIAGERGIEATGRGFIDGPPDLAIEIISPSERAADVIAKTQQWLASGAKSVWNVEPDSRTIAVYAADGSARVYHESDTLSGGDLLPGFEIAVASIFAR